MADTILEEIAAKIGSCKDEVYLQMLERYGVFTHIIVKPQAVDMQDEIALDQAMDYYDAVVHSDINRADNVQKNPERVKRLMRSYARNQGGQVPNTVLAQDIAANDETPISEESRRAKRS